MIVGMIISTATLFFLFYNNVNVWLILLGIVIFNFIYYLSKKTSSQNNVLTIDYYANKSFLKNWNATFKILFCVVLIWICVLSNEPILPLYVFLAMSALTVNVGKIKLKVYINILSTPVNFIMLSILTILLSFSTVPSGTLHISIGSYYLILTASSQTYASLIVSRVLGCIACLYALGLSTPMKDILATLKLLKIPNIIIDLMYLMYRYIFILLSTFYNMNNAAKSRLGFWGYRNSIKSIVLIAANLFFVSLHKASDSFAALESRLYGNSISFLSDKNKLTINQILYYALIITSMIIIKVWRF